MPLSSQTARIVVLNQLSKFTSNLLKVGQMDAAKVWNRCRDALQSAIKERTNWPDRDTLQKLTKRKFGLHSQSVPMVCHAFLANVKTTIELRKQGRKEVRYPYKEKRFYPLSWPAQAMALDGDRIILPMGRGRSRDRRSFEEECKRDRGSGTDSPVCGDYRYRQGSDCVRPRNTLGEKAFESDARFAC
jgi:hypothetical protein